MAKHSGLVGSHRLAPLESAVTITAGDLARTADKFLGAIQEAGRIYRHIVQNKKNGDFAVEVSVDETDTPQTPAELLIILAMIADERLPAQTIAPKFSGRFNKGVDYVGDIAAFEREFDADLAAPWNSAAIGAASSGPDANGVTVDINTTTNPHQVTVTIPATNQQAGRLFARLATELR